ncbi:hypothetical protein F66182_6201 [Fusarium sp. NRRL 66182]|nr:hypothetical protein F66182_6201 [Fusarium sp. NRRL 66182]
MPKRSLFNPQPLERSKRARSIAFTQEIHHQDREQQEASLAVRLDKIQADLGALDLEQNSLQAHGIEDPQTFSDTDNGNIQPQDDKKDEVKDSGNFDPLDKATQANRELRKKLVTIKSNLRYWKNKCDKFDQVKAIEKEYQELRDRDYNRIQELKQKLVISQSTEANLNRSIQLLKTDKEKALERARPRRHALSFSRILDEFSELTTGLLIHPEGIIVQRTFDTILEIFLPKNESCSRALLRFQKEGPLGTFVCLEEVIETHSSRFPVVGLGPECPLHGTSYMEEPCILVMATTVGSDRVLRFKALGK